MVSCDNDDHEGGRVPVRESRSSSEDKEGKLVNWSEAGRGPTSVQ